jgi:nitrite reductase (NADH) large subunit
MSNSEQAKIWKCDVCKFEYRGSEPPETCPQCGTKRTHFKSSPSLPQRVVIIGAGIAGVSAAEAIREESSSTEVTLLSEETHLPYSRMNLTRYLAGEVSRDKLDLHPKCWYQENQIELYLNSPVTEIDPRQKILRLADERSFTYDTLLLTNGAHPFVPPIAGAQMHGVQTLRTLEDADAILAAVAKPINVVCIGGGLLGLEVAGAIARRGAKVTVVESLDWLLPRQLNETASHILQAKIEAMGIDVIIGARTQAFVGDGQVRAVQLEDGRELPADLVVISAGVTPNLDLARQAGLTVNRGVIVDEHMHTSDLDIFAAGDNAEFHGRLYGLWIPSKKEGSIAGYNAVNDNKIFNEDPPSARLKVLGIDLCSIGQITEQQGDEVLSQQTDGNYAGFVFHEGKLVGAMLLGDASLAVSVQKAVNTHQDFSKELIQGMTAADLMQFLRK